MTATNGSEPKDRDWITIIVPVNDTNRMPTRMMNLGNHFFLSGAFFPSAKTNMAMMPRTIHVPTKQAMRMLPRSFMVSSFIVTASHPSHRSLPLPFGGHPNSIPHSFATKAGTIRKLARPCANLMTSGRLANSVQRRLGCGIQWSNIPHRKPIGRASVGRSLFWNVPRFVSVDPLKSLGDGFRFFDAGSVELSGPELTLFLIGCG